MAKPYILSKKTYLAGTQCLKRLWFQMHDPGDDMRETAVIRHRLQEGTEVGERARQYVPGGVLIERGGRDIQALLDDSLSVMLDRSVSIIYEAAVVAHKTLVFADILERANGGFNLIEVKSTTSVSERRHIPDLAVQAFILRSAGIPIIRCEVMHLNRECIYPDLSNLFVREDVTDLVNERAEYVMGELALQLSTARLPVAPNVETGPHCTVPSRCPFTGRCFTAQPEQRREATIDRDGLISALQTLRAPVAHIDLETIQPAIPRWNGCRPYDQVPVQLSCHVVDAGGNVRHSEWIFDGDGDPRAGMARALLDACAGAETVTAYHAPFEKMCIKLVADACPQHASELNAIAERMVDLLPIVRENIYDPAFGESFSLKKVLPALVPGMSYDDLAINDGGTATVELARMIFGGAAISSEERSRLRESLLRYCERDTEAMVALSNRLAELSRVVN